MRSGGSDCWARLGDLQLEHWRLQKQLVQMCSELQSAPDRNGMIGAAASAVAGLTRDTFVFGFACQDGAEARQVFPEAESQMPDNVAELLQSYLSRAEDWPSDADGESCFTVDPSICRCLAVEQESAPDGICVRIAGLNETAGFIILLTTDPLEDWHSMALWLVAQIAASFLARTSLEQVEAEAEGWRQMAQKIAHLTATPLQLAQCEVEDLLASKLDADENTLKRARGYLAEAGQAVERAFLFDFSPDTCASIRFDLMPHLCKAAKDAGIDLEYNQLQSIPVKGNPFRIRYALRDLFVCARMMSRESVCRINLATRGLRLTISSPLQVPRSFKPKLLFSPQHHIEVQDSEHRDWPVSISLLLSKQLLTETPPGGSVKASVSTRRDELRFEVRIPLPEEANHARQR